MVRQLAGQIMLRKQQDQNKVLERASLQRGMGQQVEHSLARRPAAHKRLRHPADHKMDWRRAGQETRAQSSIYNVNCQ